MNAAVTSVIEATVTDSWIILTRVLSYLTMESLLLLPHDETRLFCQNTQEIKRTFFNRTKQDKMCNFRRSPLFQATYYIKTEKTTTVNSTYLVSVGCGRLAEGKGHETDFFRSTWGRSPSYYLVMQRLLLLLLEETWLFSFAVTS